MNFLTKFAAGFAFAAVTFIGFGIPVLGILYAAAVVGNAYGPLAAAAVIFTGLCAVVGVCAAIFD